MSKEHVIGIGFNPEDPAEQPYRVPSDAPIGRELFPVMAVLLGQVLDLDQTTKESTR